MAILETSLEANSDRRMTEWQKKPLIGARATALPKNYKGRRQNENTKFSTKGMFRLNTTVTTFLTIFYQKKDFHHLKQIC